MAEPKLYPFLWFDKQAEEAAKFYVSVFKDSKLGKATHYTEAGQEYHKMPAGLVMTIEFWLLGQKFVALNGGPQFNFNQAVSFVVECENQDEIDHYWGALTADGGKEVQCGWLTDKFGMPWQIVPKEMGKLVGGTDEGSKKAMMAMMQMKKIDVNALKAAKEGK